MSTYSGRSRVCPKAAQRREEILDAAIRCFREKGFHAASMSSIAKAFGMSAGHIYNYFDSKEDIIEAIVNRWLDNSFTLSRSGGIRIRISIAKRFRRASVSRSRIA